MPMLWRVWNRVSSWAWYQQYQLRARCYGRKMRCPHCQRVLYWLAEPEIIGEESFCGRCGAFTRITPRYTEELVPPQEMDAATRLILPVYQRTQCPVCALENYWAQEDPALELALEWCRHNPRLYRCADHPFTAMQGKWE
jgi:hypothetical protein